VTFVVALIVGTMPTILLVRPLIGQNLGIVDEGRVIRSAQPTSQLLEIIRTHRLASILNLRGGSSHDWWYKAEVQAAQKNGVAFYDLPLVATRRPTRRQLLQLIDTLSKCNYPLLIHCKAGADRTGLASAIYLMTLKGEPPRQAMRAFSIYYNHVPFFGTEHLHEPLEEYAEWLEAQRLEHTPERFRSWIKDDYRSPDPAVDPPVVKPGPRRPIEPSHEPGASGYIK
jgi:protein tyrosine phosphatase (PTP) superfamily phosphohydrolase (DUF442 family)